MVAGAGIPGGAEAARHGWRSPRAMGRAGAALVLIGVVAAAIGHREWFNLEAEDPARSVLRFAAGAPEVVITTQMSWSRVPAVLPGPADAWAGGAAHTLVMRVPLSAPRALRLQMQWSRHRPTKLHDLPLPSVAAAARVRVVVNGTALASLDAPALSSAKLAHESRVAPSVTVPIPATALGGETTLTLALVNDGAAGVALRHVRLTDASLSIALRHLARTGRFPAVSAALLALGLGCLLCARLPRDIGVPRPPWPRGLGPGLGLALLALAAVAAPGPTRAVPLWAWLVGLLAVLPLGRSRARRAAVPRTVAVRLARSGATALLVLAALGISAAAGELALRMAFRDETWARAVLRVPAPSTAPHDPRNSLGFLEREFPLQKPSGTYRIAILGDSLSVSAPRGQRFGNVIVERLNAQSAPPVRYEAVSFGRTGADTNEETEILERVVWRAQPDFVLLEFYVNDLENGDHSGRPEGYSIIPGQGALPRWLRARTNHLLLRWMLEQQFTVAQERLGIAETYPAYMFRRFGDPGDVHWQSAAYELQRFIHTCREHAVPVAIALFPHLSPGLSTGAYEYAELYDQVLALCGEEGVPCVDLRSAFMPYRDYASLWVHRFDPHPNARAHRIAGERLTEVLGPFWLDAGQGGGRTRGAVSAAASR